MEQYTHYLIYIKRTMCVLTDASLYKVK